jgi:hypothetical protein
MDIADNPPERKRRLFKNSELENVKMELSCDLEIFIDRINSNFIDIMFGDIMNMFNDDLYDFYSKGGLRIVKWNEKDNITLYSSYFGLFRDNKENLYSFRSPINFLIEKLRENGVLFENLTDLENENSVTFSIMSSVVAPDERFLIIY